MNTPTEKLKPSQMTLPELELELRRIDQEFERTKQALEVLPLEKLWKIVDGLLPKNTLRQTLQSATSVILSYTIARHLYDTEKTECRIQYTNIRLGK